MDLFELYLLISIIGASMHTLIVFRDMLIWNEVDLVELIITFLGIFITWPLVLIGEIIEHIEDRLNHR
ncbi:MAG: hypothetical protein NC489_25635 [Ruminococcus flavefaciens]|nr:hypothetical protein [Ruminococcus flavefaciens]